MKNVINLEVKKITKVLINIKVMIFMTYYLKLSLSLSKMTLKFGVLM
jgi:hypothetical protein